MRGVAIFAPKSGKAPAAAAAADDIGDRVAMGAVGLLEVPVELPEAGEFVPFEPLLGELLAGANCCNSW